MPFSKSHHPQRLDVQQGLFIHRPSLLSAPTSTHPSGKLFQYFSISLLSTVVDIFIHIPFTLKAKTHSFRLSLCGDCLLPEAMGLSCIPCAYLLVADNQTRRPAIYRKAG
ncbi:hypothetical protein NPIL_396551 [Nephila pilipes]|uniref:Uncharacterized protein n=1 Tax=Nephila pilipes TaxID=299642 RepID=A0A8X6N087_NEPPI|nr:hypothetical protein NPIL_396551 [Nephila pilipes]